MHSAARLFDGDVGQHVLYSSGIQRNFWNTLSPLKWQRDSIILSPRAKRLCITGASERLRPHPKSQLARSCLRELSIQTVYGVSSLNNFEVAAISGKPVMLKINYFHGELRLVDVVEGSRQ